MGTSSSTNSHDHSIPTAVRTSYVQAISSIQPCDELEQEDIEATLEWIHTAEHLNKPHNMEQHLGVFIVILSQDRKHTYLLEHRKARLWLPPGGHVDLGDTLDECAVLEVQEELGIDQPKLISSVPVFLTRTLTQGVNAGHIDVTAWLVIEEEMSTNYTIQEKEATAARWFSVEELLEADELSHLHRGFQKMRSQGLV